jgi:hypothetical protein
MIEKWDKFIQSLEKITDSDKPLKEMMIKMSYFFIMLIVIPLFFTSDDTIRYTDVKKGSVATKRVVAPFNFFILKTDEELTAERNQAVNNVPYYFEYNLKSTSDQLNKLETAIHFVTQHKSAPYDTLYSARTEKIINNLKELENSFSINLNIQEWISLSSVITKKTSAPKLSKILEIIRKNLQDGILDIDPRTLKRDLIAYKTNDIEEVYNKTTKKDIFQVLNEIDQNIYTQFDDDEATALSKFLKQILRPNLIFAQKMTDDAVEKAVKDVSLTKDMVYENERIVDANERIDEEIFQKLYSLEYARVKKSEREGNWQPFFAELGKIMLLGSILFMVGMYLFSFRKKIFMDNKKLLLISIVILLQISIAAIVSGPLNWPVYVIPTTIASMLMAILIDSGIAFVVTACIALILGGVLGGGYDISLMTMVSGMVAIYSVHEIRNRNQILKAILYISIAYIWIIIAITFLRFDSYETLGRIFLYNLLPNAVFAPFFTYMVLGIFERLFDITTDVRLLELSDLNHPLLKELSLKAPGTFHHSMIVGNLAEAASKEIGENSLLARVGSYYHDIGKMEKPEYFIENQMDSKNLHSKLTPSMSALILASHVKTGLEMALTAKLPKRIRDFIVEHHGTSLMYYFYNKAIETAGDKGTVNDADFRYPGPKPKSKTSAIVMMADTVEAATRTLKSPNPSKIKAYVAELVNQKYEDGELDECDLTFKELKQIISSFMPVLYGVFQQRVEYPEKDGSKKTNKNKTQTIEKPIENGN